MDQVTIQSHVYTRRHQKRVFEMMYKVGIEQGSKILRRHIVSVAIQ